MQIPTGGNLDAHNQADADSESRGGDHRPVTDNGTRGRTFSVGAGGQDSVTKVDYALPPDPNAPHGDDGDNDMNTAETYGVDESKEVGCECTINQYGLEGHSPAAGGGVSRNKR